MFVVNLAKRFGILFQNLPATQLPDIFGMHDNVDIARELQETKLLFDSVLLTQGRSSGGADSSADEKLLETAKTVYEKVIIFLPSL